MSAQPMEQRVARLEAGFEQLDKRLSGVETQLVALRLSFETEFRAQRTTMDQKFLFGFGLILSTWITTMLTIVFHR